MAQRVAIVVEQNWNAVPGGTARSTNRLIEELLTFGDLDLIGVHGSHRHGPQLPLPSGLRAQKLPIPGRLLTQVWNRLPVPELERWIGTVDLVHGPGYVLPGSRANGIVTIHDLAFVDRPDWFTAHGARFLNRFFERVVAEGTAVLVPSQATADACIEAGVAAEAIAVTPWGSDPPDVSAEAVDAVRSRYGLTGRYVLFVGTREPRKNLDGLVAAMALLPNERLVVVGPDGWGEIDLGGAMVLGRRPGDEVAALMAGAALLAYPSHLEGFGLPVLEAMGQGTPVVVTAGGAPAEIAGAAGLAVDTTDADVLAGAIARILDDATLAAELGAEARTRAAMYSWAEAARRTQSAYESAAR